MMRILWLLLTGFLLIVFAACRTNETPEGQVKDVTITANVKAKLASELQPSTLTNVSVNSTNAVVTLSGQVGSAEQKRRAEEIARSVDGVQRINNNLQVQATP